MNNSPLIDPYLRPITYLRVSVTDRCDFRCTYCMNEDIKFLPKREVLSLEELDRMCSAFVELGVKKIRVTGGEPLVRRDIQSLFKRLSRHLDTGALDELTLTTNGSQLARYAKQLAEFGVKRVNVSLDTLDQDKFARITRRGRLSNVLMGIEAAKAAGIRVKINAVALKGFNDSEFLRLIDWCAAENMDITFIEVMPMGEGIGDAERIGDYYSLLQLRDDIEKHHQLRDIPLRTGGPARYVERVDNGQKIGFITPLSHNFCESCNRVRVTCTGELFMCLGQEDKADLRDVMRSGKDPQALHDAIRQAISRKPKGHNFDYARGNVKGKMSRNMSHTGG